MTDTKKNNPVLIAKDRIAKIHGFPDNVIDNSWNYAMQITHRTKMQIKLYEEVLELMNNTIQSLLKKKG